MDQGCMAVVSIPRPTHRNGSIVEAAAEKATSRELALQQSVASPVRAAGPSLPSRRSLGATSFPLAAAGVQRRAFVAGHLWGLAPL